MSSRPVTHAAAVALLAVIGTGVVLVGVFLLAIAAGAVALLDPVGGVLGMVGLLGVASIAAGIAVYVAAAGLWMRRGWAWYASLAIAVAAVGGALVALDSAGPQLPLEVGLVLASGTVGLLVSPQTRSAVGIA
jgi:hypothetical protein